MHVKLTRDYPIRGDRFRAGQVVEVIDATAAWLIGQGIAVAADGDTEVEPDGRQDLIQAAIRDMLESDPNKEDESLWTKGGKPDVKALASLLGYEISAAERDAAWEAAIE